MHLSDEEDEKRKIHLTFTRQPNIYYYTYIWQLY